MIYIYIYIYNIYISLTDCNKFTKYILDVKIQKDELVNERGLNKNIKTLLTKQESNKNSIKSRTR